MLHSEASNSDIWEPTHTHTQSSLSLTHITPPPTLPIIISAQLNWKDEHQSFRWYPVGQDWVAVNGVSHGGWLAVGKDGSHGPAIWWEMSECQTWWGGCNPSRMHGLSPQGWFHLYKATVSLAHSQHLAYTGEPLIDFLGLHCICATTRFVWCVVDLAVRWFELVGCRLVVTNMPGCLNVRIQTA